MEMMDTQSKIAVMEYEIKEVKKDIEQLSGKVDSNHREVVKKISEIEKFRWMMVGGSVIIGYVIAHLKLERLF
ncbi:MAG: hypothetical protein EBR82_44580 [Caulobacteraceae bacterium]|nr:hypothetical protein [Caulobacteraceae bacterium]NDG32350.1 hypothetical protein [bacterium]